MEALKLQEALQNHYPVDWAQRFPDPDYLINTKAYFDREPAVIYAPIFDQE